MNRYEELKNRQRKEFNEFPLGAAFSDKQFAEMMNKWGLTVNDIDKIYSLGAGCFIRKSDSALFHEIMDRHMAEREQAIAKDETGEGYIYEMFATELANHEYGYTGDVECTLDALDLTEELINADERLLYGFQKALGEYSASQTSFY